MLDTWNIIVALLAVIGLLTFLSAVRALRTRRYFRGMLRSLIAIALLMMSGLAGTLSIAVQGYRALTHEEIAAKIRVTPTGKQQFNAVVRFVDGRELAFDLVGDQLYVDAHILKWKPLANFVGLHTAYELDRIAGRFSKIAEERAMNRTVHSLSLDKPLDLFDLRRRYALLSPLVDTDYGSATFIVADSPADYEVRVTTSGLLVRRLAPAAS